MTKKQMRQLLQAARGSCCKLQEAAAASCKLQEARQRRSYEMRLIDKIKKEVPYLAAYAWLHNAALREDSDREACGMTIALMQIIHKIEALGTSVQCHGMPEIKYIAIERKGRTIMEIGIQEVYNDSETVF